MQEHRRRPRREATDDDRIRFNSVLRQWAGSLAARHALGGRMTVSPEDTPYGDFNPIVRAFQVPPEVLEQAGRENVVAKYLNELRAAGKDAMGDAAYDRLLDELTTDHEDDLRLLWQVLNEPGSGGKVILPHVNIQDEPLMQIVMGDALSRIPDLEPEFDLFRLYDQSYVYLSPTLGHMDWQGAPAFGIMSKSSNLVKVYPPTSSGLDNLKYENGKLDPGLTAVAREINDAAKTVMEADTEALRAKGLSRLDYIAPAASTMDKVYASDEETLIGLRAKEMPAGAAQRILTENSLLWVIALWMDPPNGSSWKIFPPTRIEYSHDPNLSKKEAEEQHEQAIDSFNELMAALNQTTAELAGVDLIPPNEDQLEAQEDAA